MVFWYFKAVGSIKRVENTQWLLFVFLSIISTKLSLKMSGLLNTDGQKDKFH